MNVKSFCAGRPDRKKLIAEACGVSVPAVSHWCTGIRSPEPKYWRTIITASDGEITVEDLLDAAESQTKAAA